MDNMYNMAIAKLKATIQLRAPFFGALAMMTPVKISEKVLAATTDGVNIYVGKWFLNQEKGVQLFILMHELAHKALLHVYRIKDRDIKKYNVASDYVVNSLLNDISWVKIPDWALHDHKFDGMSVEEVYELIPDIVEDSFLVGDILPADKDLFSQAKAQVITAVKNSQPGTVPGIIEEQVEALDKPKIDWKLVLREFLLAAGPKIKTDWSMPSRRAHTTDVYLPRNNTINGIFQLFILVDVSGSVFHLSKIFISEINGILSSYPDSFNETHLIFCDTTVVKHVQDLHDFDSRIINTGGGTDLRVGINYISKLCRYDAQAKALIILTDGYTPWPDNPPVIPTLIAIPEEVGSLKNLNDIGTLLLIPKN